MLWNAATLRGYAVQGTAGPAGTVAALLFDESWTVRALVNADGSRLPVEQVNKLDGQHRRVEAKLAAGEAPRRIAEAGTLREIARLLEMDLQATDGGVGPVRDVLFQDSDWKIRYFTVDAGDGKGKLLVAADAVASVDWAAGTLALNVNRKAVAAGARFEGDLGVDGAGADDHAARRSYFGVEIVPPETGPGLPD